ncbi:RNA ligase-domain-containing protein [Pilobolus umbonatus]|nr:RNA ligase-domain-containing protein [Pilobolus umbonatus]
MNTLNIPSIDLKLDEAHEVVSKLYEFQKEYPKEVRTKDYTLEDGQVWTSWVMRESVYKKKAALAPIMARGLFTQKVDNRYVIRVRGYDKFFNLTETKETQWPFIEADTTGPYEVTSKENGCIIFIVALNSERVVVTSKHSTTSVKDDLKSHSAVGYNWVIKHLASVNKTEKDLAEWLYPKKVTLVGELCDDEFEEHVLPYHGRERGLYLHGINYNTKKLNTLPSSTVLAVAKLFGFHPTAYEQLDTITELKELAVEVAKSCLYKNKETEGVVIRCQRHGDDFFFKIKNEQYLLYREYREVTKQLLDEVEKEMVLKEKVVRYRFEKTESYIKWLRQEVMRNPHQFAEYKRNRGIVDARQRFEGYWEIEQLKMKDLSISEESKN